MDKEAFALLLQEPNYLLDFVVLLLVIMGTGLLLVAFHRRDSALASHAPQILYLTFMLPIVLMLAIFLGISKDAVVGLVGIIIGYIFGISPPVPGRGRSISSHDAEDVHGRRGDMASPSLIDLPERQRASRWKRKGDLRSEFGPERSDSEDPSGDRGNQGTIVTESNTPAPN